MSLITEILDELWNTPFIRYKGGVQINIFGIPRFDNYNKHSIQSTLSKLKKNGFVRMNNGTLQVTERGRKYLNDFKNNFHKLPSPFKQSSPKNLILMFDIPEERRRHRNWLRDQLKEYGYKMIQQSVWVGPSPLPSDFKKFITEIKINNHIKTFKLANNFRFKK